MSAAANKNMIANEKITIVPFSVSFSEKSESIPGIDINARALESTSPDEIMGKKRFPCFKSNNFNIIFPIPKINKVEIGKKSMKPT